ncbi:MAG: FadR family transcriptional regulator [Lachnospiraceae bacterium]|nr:FadR family transcriptional regulator [Lachnospiraceae bacterium]
MEFTKLNAPSLKELFVQELETLILSGKLEIGEKLPSERNLADSMQVSRAVVNSGITELARKGFLIIKPRVGTFVADYRRNGTMDTLRSIMNYNGGILREAEIRSILELRIALDTLAIQLWLPRASNEEIHRMRGFTEEIKTTSSITNASELAFQFQHELAFLSGNTLIPLIFSSFKVPVISLWERFCKLYGIEELYKNNDKLCHYFENHDVEQAIAWIAASIQDTIKGNRLIYFREQ